MNFDAQCGTVTGFAHKKIPSWLTGFLITFLNSQKDMEWKSRVKILMVGLKLDAR